MMPAMSEIISFPCRMHFTALRTFDIRGGIGGVVAILWRPVNHTQANHGQRQERGGHPAVSALLAMPSCAIEAVALEPTVPHDSHGQ